MTVARFQRLPLIALDLVSRDRNALNIERLLDMPSAGSRSECWVALVRLQRQHRGTAQNHGRESGLRKGLAWCPMDVG
jgi:hypothetical protein